MTMIRTSKKLLLVLIICVFTFSLSGCFKNKYEEMPNGVDITMSTYLKGHLLYEDQVPVLHFDFPGARVMKEYDGAAYFFVSNDQYVLSDKFAEHIKQYKPEQITVMSEVEQERDKKGMARFGDDKLPLDDTLEDGTKQKHSMEYQLVCCNDQGVRYSYQFRTFVSGGKRYYIYQYTNNIGIGFEQSVMVIKGTDGGENKLVFTPLPYDTKYEVSASTVKLDALLHKDTYLNDNYNKFAYPEYLKDYTDEDKESMVREWYTTYCNGQMVGEDFIVTYLGAKFKVVFGVDKVKDDKFTKGFQLIYLGDA